MSRTNFAAWSIDSLVRFCVDAEQRIDQQVEEIETLRADLKLMTAAWRKGLQQPPADATVYAPEAGWTPIGTGAMMREIR